jgi:hypothetical protein
MSVTITHDTATARLAELHAAIAPGRRQGLMNVLGRTAEKEYRSWFRTREMTSANKKGWPRQHFWARISRATAFSASQTTDSQATVVISDPAIRAKVRGAVIRPTGGRKALAIPLRAEAYGVRPSSGIIPGLFVVGGKAGRPAYLAKREAGGFRNLTLYYRLVSSVTVPADPQALPDSSAVSRALVLAAAQFLLRKSTRLA